MDRQRDIERLYTFSRAILLIDPVEPVAKQLARKLAEVFGLRAVVLYDRRSGEIHRAGPSDFDGMEGPVARRRLAGHILLRSRTQARSSPRSVLAPNPSPVLPSRARSCKTRFCRAISNLIAIGLERARAQDLAHQVEAARRSEQLRTTLIDAMAHEFKTPLTSIRAATTSLLSSPDQPIESRTELLQVADEEARHLQELIDDAVDMARLESDHIQVRREPTDPKELIDEVVASLRTQIDNRPVEIQSDGPMLPQLALDRRLLKLALKQVLDNALKYSPPRSPITVRFQWPMCNGNSAINFEITDHGQGIPEQEQGRLFERFYRSPSVKNQVPGFGLGLAIANNIVQAHHGELTVNSRPGETTFRMTLPFGHLLPRRPNPPSRGAPMSAGRILVVDDEPQIRRIMRTTLTGCRLRGGRR